MMGREKNNIGKAGETEAAGFLERNGYKIIAANLRSPFGELDMVARKEDFIVFIEVKTRTGSSLGPPCLAVTGKKARHIIRNALCYLKRTGCVDSFWRIDVVSVMLNGNYEAEKIELIENAVTADDYYFY